MSEDRNAFRGKIAFVTGGGTGIGVRRHWRLRAKEQAWSSQATITSILKTRRS